MSEPVSVVNIEQVAWERESYTEHYASASRRLSGRMALGVRLERLSPGKVSCPYHYHLKEDEFFLVVRGKALLRTPEGTREVTQGDAISCPHGELGAHQLYNHGTEDVEFLAVGQNQPDEVCHYPDSGKWMVRAIKKVGLFSETEYWHAEPDPPLVTR
jgi:uncharacterized cupin superfamily protein